MKLLNSHPFKFLHKLLTDLLGLVTSKEKIRQLWSIRLYSNTIYLAITNMAGAVLGFFFWVIIARFYSPEEVGLASALISAVSLVAALSTLGMDQAVVRFLPESHEGGNKVVDTIFTLVLLTSISGVVIFVIGLGLWSQGLIIIRQNPVYLLCFLLFTVLFSASTVLDRIFIARRRAGFVVARNVIFGLLKLPLPILLVSFMASLGIFASWGISLVIAFIISMFWFLPRVQHGYRPSLTINRSVVQEITRFSLANYIADLLWGIPTMMLPIMVVNLLGAEPNAYLSIALLLGNVPGVLSGAASSSLFAEGSNDIKSLGLHIRRSVVMILVTLVPLALVLLIFADKFLLIFGGVYSENSTTLVRIIVLSTVPLSFNNIFFTKMRVDKNLKAIIGFSSLAAPLTLGLAYVLLPEIGINGAGIAWLSAQTLVALAIAFTLLGGKRLFKKKP